MNFATPGLHTLLVAIVVCVAGTGASFVWIDGHDPFSRTFSAMPGDARALLENLAIFGHGTAVLIATLLIWNLDRHHRRNLGLVIAAPLFAGFLANLVKVIVQRPRPFVAELPGLHSSSLGEVLMNNSMQSFPSGHTASAVALALALACHYPKGRWLFLSLAIVTGFERVLSQSHFPSDVFAGAATGMFAFLLTRTIVQQGFLSVQWTSLLAKLALKKVISVR